MLNYAELKDHFKARSILLNIILDGYGIGKQDHTDAVWSAQTPVMDKLLKTYANTKLFTHGGFVGLPGDTDMGGSEVGHMTIGAGTVMDQGTKLIDQMIADGSFFRQPALQKAVEAGKKSALHLLGLLSDGNIHSNISHWIAVIRCAAEAGVKRCFFHILLDGRDVGIQSADSYIEQLQKITADITGARADMDYRIISGGGREFMTMDRSLNWDKVKIGWDAHVHGKSPHIFPDALSAVRYFRKQQPDIIDQDIPSFVTEGTPGIQDGDSVICVNFRGDRAVEISRAFSQKDFREFDTGHRPQVHYCGMMVYDQDTNMPAERIIEIPPVKNPFGKRILALGLNQFRLAETQKFPHVTFFFNGGYRLPLDPKKEEYCIIPSDVIPSFASKPAMKATEIGNKAVEFIRSGRFQYGLINFANPDMVGHTGDFKATVAAVEAVDTALGKILDALATHNGIAVVTADHGNADEMLIKNKKGDWELSTKHSINAVPFVIFDPGYNGEYQLKQQIPEKPLGLSSIAATNFIMLGRDAPADLHPHLFSI